MDGEKFENPGRLVLGCQFGNHGEPFLWVGSGNDDIDLAIMELMRLSQIDLDSALEVADEIGSLFSKAKDKSERIKTPDGECSCCCIDCIEGNHCGRLFIVETEEGEEAVGECRNLDGILNSMEEQGMFGNSQEDEEDDNDDPWDDEN